MAIIGRIPYFQTPIFMFRLSTQRHPKVCKDLHELILNRFEDGICLEGLAKGENPGPFRRGLSILAGTSPWGSPGLLHGDRRGSNRNINSRGTRFANGTCEYEDCWYAHGAQIAGERWAALLDFDYLKSCDYLKS